MKKTSRNFIDPEQGMVSHDNSEQYNQRLQEKTRNTGEKRSSPPDEYIPYMNNIDDNKLQQMTPQEMRS